MTESPIKRQKQHISYYSGKKKHYILKLKTQVVVNQKTGQIICNAFGKEAVHDFRLFKLDCLPMLTQQLCLADKGYQGLAN